ncbi:site-specific integrase [Lactobacillus helsingborgensis]|uniref:tyrosine-type recombinase/integrase n=1 Tax=Lactobacillus helsingborgensis TaxID=1218494 RepID=UPI00164F01F4|nr:tyrosine-type recombinase/integrase [Lactobacillus helsingborgensis]MBC6356722.1 site-specific integrase [Lactobacillus helsingborgensis]
MRCQERIVKPIKDSWVLQSVQKHLLEDFESGRRNYTIFKVGKATLLRVSDVLALRKSDVYDKRGKVKRNAYIIDKKTKKHNVLYLKPVERDLEDYYDWLKEFTNKFAKSNPKAHLFESEWLFPSFKRPEKHIDGSRYYMIMHKVGETLNINYLGTHTMRKTGAYRVYEQSGHNIALVMKLLNHSSEEVTLAYLGLDQESRESILDKIDFG